MLTFLFVALISCRFPNSARESKPLQQALHSGHALLDSAQPRFEPVYPPVYASRQAQHKPRQSHAHA